MKRILFSALLAVSVVFTALAGRTGTMKIRGVNCEYELLAERHVGPGVTYALYQFNNMMIGGYVPYKMRTHLLTVDMTNPYNRLSPYMAADKYYECATLEEEERRQKEQGYKPFAAVNCMGFAETPPSNGEPYHYMEVNYHLVSQGLIRYENNSTQVRYYNDASNKGHIGNLTMNGKVTSSSGASVAIGQINHFRDYVRGKNQLALFCNGMDNAKDNNTADGVEVFLSGSSIMVGTNSLEVVRKGAGCGRSIPSGQHVITGVGAEVEAFLNGLSEGETVTIEIGYTDASGSAVVPSNTFTSFIPNCVREGVANVDPTMYFAFTATGVSKDGNTVYLADFENSQYSDAPSCCLADFLIEVGAWNASYNDGGPSAEMTVDGSFVSTNSIGGGFNGRYTPNGLMLYSTAPDDNVIVSVESANAETIETKVGETVAVKLYGFNQYGEMIDSNVGASDVVDVSISGNVGTFASGKFTATNIGYGEITVSLPGRGEQVTIPVLVRERRALIVTPSKVFTCDGRNIQLKAQLAKGDVVTDLDPSEVTWQSDDRYVVRKWANGYLEPYYDGVATITATYQDLTAKVLVEVENLYNDNPDEVDLTRKTYNVDNINAQLPSVPRALYLEIQLPETEGQTATLTYTAGDNLIQKDLAAIEGESTIRATLKFDYDDVYAYPVTVKSISPSSAKVLSMKAIYTENYSGIQDLYADDAAHFEFSRSGEQLMLINCSAATEVMVAVYSLNGVKLAAQEAYLSEAGSCALDVKVKDPIIVRVQTKSGVHTYKLMGE